jgi:cytochrome o ubiquinol oxidase subunit 2
MPTNRKKGSLGKVLTRIILAVTCFALLIAVFLHGNNVALFNPKGLIAHQQHGLMLLVVGIMFVIAIPTLSFFFYTVWKYRESNTKAVHDPNVRHGKLLDVTIWLIPTAFAVVLAVIMWGATHRLEPQKSIAADAQPITIQVVSMRWKWLFIYPEQKIATVNFVQIPVHTPVHFQLTADDAPMSSFWIPNLGGQLYTMTGMVNNLNLMADEQGDYPGSSAEINGAGFAAMKFTARASSRDDFDSWVKAVKQSTGVLDAATYQNLLKPSENNPSVFYSSATAGLYDAVLMKYMAPAGASMQMDHDHNTHDTHHMDHDMSGMDGMDMNMDAQPTREVHN